MIQGYASHAFKSKFESWPACTATGNSGAEDGRGKVAGSLFFIVHWDIKKFLF